MLIWCSTPKYTNHDRLIIMPEWKFKHLKIAHNNIDVPNKCFVVIQKIQPQYKNEPLFAPNYLNIRTYLLCVNNH